ncbi:hypothetical protein Aduo_015537 [Ancylostoma duodenale]
MEPDLIILLLLLAPFTSYFGNQARYIDNDLRCALFELETDREPRAVVEDGLSAELMDSEEVSVAFRGTTAPPKDVPSVLRSINPVAASQTTNWPSRQRPRGFSGSAGVDSAFAPRVWSDSSDESGGERRFLTSEISLESDSDEIGREFTFRGRPRRGRRGLVRVAVNDGS